MAKGVVKSISENSFTVDDNNQPVAPYFKVHVAITEVNLRRRTEKLQIASRRYAHRRCHGRRAHDHVLFGGRHPAYHVDGDAGAVGGRFVERPLGFVQGIFL